MPSAVARSLAARDCVAADGRRWPREPSGWPASLCRPRRCPSSASSACPARLALLARPPGAARVARAPSRSRRRLARGTHTCAKIRLCPAPPRSTVRGSSTPYRTRPASRLVAPPHAARNSAPDTPALLWFWVSSEPLFQIFQYIHEKFHNSSRAKFFDKYRLLFRFFKLLVKIFTI